MNKHVNVLHPAFPAFKDFLGFDDIMRALKENQSINTNSYPPYNVYAEMQDGNVKSYTVEVAVAGFTLDQLSIEVADNELKIEADKILPGYHPGSLAEETKNEDENRHYLHKGIAQRYFHLKFKLDQHVEVKSADLQNGILTVYLEEQIPERLKPKKIEIKQKHKE